MHHFSVLFQIILDNTFHNRKPRTDRRRSEKKKALLYCGKIVTDYTVCTPTSHRKLSDWSGNQSNFSGFLVSSLEKPKCHDQVSSDPLWLACRCTCTCPFALWLNEGPFCSISFFLFFLWGGPQNCTVHSLVASWNDRCVYLIHREAMGYY